MHEQPDVSRDSTTAASQTPAHRHRCCATTAADSRSDRPMQRSATHSNAATQQHSNTRSLPHTAAHGDQRETYTQTPKHAAPQLHTPLHCTLNVLVSTVVTHNGGAASHTRPRHQAAASSTATPGGTHNTSTTVLQSLSALILQQCDTPHRTRVALVPPQPPTTHALRSTALPLQRSGNARVHAAQRDAHTRAINR